MAGRENEAQEVVAYAVVEGRVEIRHGPRLLGLEHMADLLVFAPGEVILREGEPADRFYMVIKGEAEASQTGPDGAQVTIARFDPGDYFGEVGLLNDAPRIATVRAKTALEVMALDRAAFSRLLESSQATKAEVRRVAEGRERLDRR